MTISDHSSGQQEHRHSLGVIQLCAGMLIIPFLDVFAKLLGMAHGPLEVTFWRFLMQTVLMLPLWSRYGFGAFQPERPCFKPGAG